MTRKTGSDMSEDDDMGLGWLPVYASGNAIRDSQNQSERSLFRKGSR